MANKTFLRQNSNLLKKLGHKWRKPRGRQSKMREERAGKAPIVKVGYGTSAANRHLHPSGLREVLVSNVGDLKSVEKNVAVRISAAVGTRKRLQIVEEAKKAGLKILNVNEVKLRTIANAHTKKKENKKKEEKATKKEEKKETKKDEPKKEGV